jgi:hypothetical protein
MLATRLELMFGSDAFSAFGAAMPSWWMRSQALRKGRDRRHRRPTHSDQRELHRSDLKTGRDRGGIVLKQNASIFNRKAAQLAPFIPRIEIDGYHFGRAIYHSFLYLLLVALRRFAALARMVSSDWPTSTSCLSAPSLSKSPR